MDQGSNNRGRQNVSGQADVGSVHCPSPSPGCCNSAQPLLSTGDRLADVTGVIGYSFDRYELLATETAVVTDDRTVTDNNTLLRGDANHVSVATYNLENLDPTDTKFDLLADDIVYSLGAPDIIAVQEIQDANGAASGGSLSGTVTAQLLIDAIYAESGLLQPELPGRADGARLAASPCGYRRLAVRLTRWWAPSPNAVSGAHHPRATNR